MLIKTIDVQTEGMDLTGLLLLIADGAEVILTERNIPVARLLPMENRVAGLHVGAIQANEDFDDPLPDEFWVPSS